MRQLVVLAVVVAVLHAASVKVPTFRTGSMIKRLMKAGQWQKYLTLMDSNRASGNTPLIDWYDDFYLHNITMGTPPQMFTIVPDTGSSNTWVIDMRCNTQACRGQPQSGWTKNRFDTTLSTTYVNDPTTFSIQYGSGSCTGHQGDDVIAFAGLSYATQKIGVATSIAEVFGYQPIDGIMGIGWPALAVNNVIPPLQNMLPNLDMKLFVAWLDLKGLVFGDGAGGLMTYGALDTMNCDANIAYVPLSSQTYWQFAMDGFAIGSQNQQRSAQVISDTGTSWIGGPQANIQQIVTATSARYDSFNQIYYVPCSAMNSLPPLVLTIGGMPYSIPPNEYVLDLELGNGNCAITFFAFNGGGFGPSWILGDTFIRQFCNIYNIETASIGFALARH